MSFFTPFEGTLENLVCCQQSVMRKICVDWFFLHSDLYMIGKERNIVFRNKIISENKDFLIVQKLEKSSFLNCFEMLVSYDTSQLSLDIY